MSMTYQRLAHDRLARLWTGLYGQPPTPEARARMDATLMDWGERVIPAKPAWPSDIGDDHSPFEFSVATDGPKRSVRFLVEAQGKQPSLASTRDAALAATERLGELGANLSRFEQVRDILLPDVPEARFSLWHAIQLSGALEAKAYFNPQILGKARSYGLVEAAMDRLGFAKIWPSILAASQRRTEDDEIRYFALDLHGGTQARVKVYFYQRGVDVEHLERMASVRPGYVRGEVSEVCRAITGTTGPYAQYPVCTYLSVVEGELVPTEFAVQIPIRFYAANDAIARDRIIAYLTSRGLSSAGFEAALDAMSMRPLSAGSGLISYVSLRTGSARMTYYLSFEAFGVGAPRDQAVGRARTTSSFPR